MNLANRSRAELYFGAACLTGAATSLFGAYIHHVGRSIYSDVVIVAGFSLATVFAVMVVTRGGHL